MLIDYLIHFLIDWCWWYSEQIVVQAYWSTVLSVYSVGLYNVILFNSIDHTLSVNKKTTPVPETIFTVLELFCEFRIF